MTLPLDEWNLQPFEKLKPLNYRDRFSRQEYERIKNGHTPESMDDKWIIVFENDSLFLYRSWTGKAVYRVDFVDKLDGYTVKAAYIEDALCREDNADYQAGILSFLVDNILLSRNTPFPVDQTKMNLPAGVYQHHIAGSGYKEVPFKPPRPWWKFWAPKR